MVAITKWVKNCKEKKIHLITVLLLMVLSRKIRVWKAPDLLVSIYYAANN